MNAIELQIGADEAGGYIGLEPFLGVLRQGKALDDYAYRVGRTAMFDQLLWWACTGDRACERRHESIAD
jgi:hypothetical protein